MSKDAAQAHLDTYLAQVHRHLKGLPDAEVRETLAELRSHVLDKVAGDLSVNRVEAAIAELGSPREVARVNVTERVIADLEESRSPLRVLRSVGRLASLSVYGTFAFLVTLLGYGSAFGFLMTAAAKPFFPDKAGMWIYRSADGDLNFSIGINDTPQAHEVMGYWIIPVGLLAALVLAWLTWRFGLFSLRLMGRRARRTR